MPKITLLGEFAKHTNMTFFNELRCSVYHDGIVNLNGLFVFTTLIIDRNQYFCVAVKKLGKQL
jgi:hypothetical protein